MWRAFNCKKENTSRRTGDALDLQSSTRTVHTQCCLSAFWIGILLSMGSGFFYRLFRCGVSFFRCDSIKNLNNIKGKVYESWVITGSSIFPSKKELYHH